jgi:hypothetical protein
MIGLELLATQLQSDYLFKRIDQKTAPASKYTSSQENMLEFLDLLENLLTQKKMTVILST